MVLLYGGTNAVKGFVLGCGGVFESGYCFVQLSGGCRFLCDTKCETSRGIGSVRIASSTTPLQSIGGSTPGFRDGPPRERAYTLYSVVSNSKLRLTVTNDYSRILTGTSGSIALAFWSLPHVLQRPRVEMLAVSYFAHPLPLPVSFPHSISLIVSPSSFLVVPNRHVKQTDHDPGLDKIQQLRKAERGTVRPCNGYHA